MPRHRRVRPVRRAPGRARQARIRAFGHVTGRAPGRVRRRPRRRALLAGAATVLAVAAATVLLTGPDRTGGDVATEPPSREVSEEPSPSASREPQPGATADQLLDADRVSRLDPAIRWRVVSTRTRTEPPAPLTGCHETAAPDPRRSTVLVRTFDTASPRGQSAVEAIEVSGSTEAAAAAHARLLGAYADCQVPRLQLLDTFRMRRAGTDVTVLELREWTSPVRSVTVALTRTGVVTSVFAHEVEGPEGPRRGAFESAVEAALGRLCPTTGGCGRTSGLEPVPPPPTGAARGFLGVVDLPPVARLATPWVGTRTTSADPNVAATLCDRSRFTGPAFARARSRSFVLPGAPCPTGSGSARPSACCARGRRRGPSWPGRRRGSRPAPTSSCRLLSPAPAPYGPATSPAGCGG